MSSMVVALGIVSAFVLLSGVSLARYAAADAIKVIVALTAFFGAPLGAIGTYFFTRTEVGAIQNELTSARNETATYRAQAAASKTEAADWQAKFAGVVASAHFDSVPNELSGMHRVPGHKTNPPHGDAAAAAPPH